MKRCIPSGSYLIKQQNVRYMRQAQRNIDQKKEAVVHCDSETEEQTIDVDRFNVLIERKNGAILGVKIVHSSGDSLSLDFSYT